MGYKARSRPHLSSATIQLLPYNFYYEWLRIKSSIDKGN